MLDNERSVVDREFCTTVPIDRARGGGGHPPSDIMNFRATWEKLTMQRHLFLFVTMIRSVLRASVSVASRSRKFRWEKLTMQLDAALYSYSWRSTSFRICARTG
eukprot:scaffold7091_cov273-Chaetoceros_neogracile.AAC.9